MVNTSADITMKRTFCTEKPVIGMLHLLGGGEDDVLSIAREEIEIMYGAGVSAVMVENYFGDTRDVENVLALLQKEYADHVYGVNVLGDFETAFRLAKQYGAVFVQVDSICGHLPPSHEQAYFDAIDRCRAETGVFLMGGVRFKYQPVCSSRPLSEDLAIGRRHCDAIVVTGEGTGIATNMEKIKEFRSHLPDFPLIVGAGITADTCAAQLAVADGGIVGSYFKFDGNAHNRMDADRVRRFILASREAK